MINKQNNILDVYKQTKLSFLPQEWEVVRLIEYVNLERGTEPGSKNYNKNKKGIRFIRVVDISGSREDIIYTTSNNIKLCSTNDILITFDGSPGIVKKGFIGAFSSGIRKINFCNDSIDSNYVFYVLQTDFVQEIILKYSSGVTIKHAGKSIPHILIPLPPLPEQKKIAYVLSVVQEAEEKIDKYIQVLKELKKSIIKHLFTYGILPINEIGKVELKKTEIGKIPKHWEMIKINDVYEISKKFRTQIKNNEKKPFLLFSLPEQEYIIFIFSRIDKQIEVMENKKKAIKELFNSLLKNLMTAKIRVNHLNLKYEINRFINL